MKGRLLFLGTGASLGIPVIGCQCAVCQSHSHFNKRLRPSALISIHGKKILIDAGPDFRQQALKHQIHQLEGILLTHAHHDHTAGFDELRALYYRHKKPLPILLSEATAQDVKSRFYYLFQPGNPYEKFAPRLDLQILPALEGKVIFEGIPIEYMTYQQGEMLVNGFRFGNLAYLSDIRLFSPAIFEHLIGVKTLIISALRHDPSPLHFSVQEAIDFAAQTEAEHIWLTHISHDLDHAETNQMLPSHIKLAYDGLELDFW